MTCDEEMIRVVLIFAFGVTFYYCVGYTLHRLCSKIEE